MKAIVDYIHRNGQRAGIYWLPGVPKAVEAAATVKYPQAAVTRPVGVPY
jgi:hypothetical protein